MAGGTTRLRLAFLGAIFASLVATLVLRLWFLQVLSHNDYLQQAQQNQVRLVPEEPARGNILDRNGEVLVTNGASLVVSMRRNDLDEDERKLVIGRLATLMGVPVEQLNDRFKDRTLPPYSPVPIADGVSEETVAYIREHQDRFPSVITESVPTRIYPNGRLAAHLLGFLGEIDSKQLDEQRYDGYRPGSIIGRGGIEFAYERDLHGKEGLLKLEVDSSGDVRRTLGRRDAQRGYDLVTTLDTRIQAVAEDSLRRGIEKARTLIHEESLTKYLAPAGGAVVLDPRNGEILAMASFPDYDPAAFVGGISQAEFKILADDPANPMLNRVIQVAHPPGSTFKTVTAAAALETGTATANGRYDCPASQRYADTTFRNWKSTNSGMMTVVQAMADSCDTVFYPWGYKFYRDYRASKGQDEILQRFAREFGFGSRTGVEIPFENAGRVPDEEWLKTMHSKFPVAFPYATWLPGYTVNMSIGQGDVLATPLQVANSYAALANGGTIYQPHFGLRLMEGDTVVKTVAPAKPRSLGMDPANLAAIKAGLQAVTEYGTASAAFNGFPLASVGVASKTGTAEFGDKHPFAWFAAYAPSNDPQYVVVVMLEEGGHGGQTAAPIARRIIEGIFNLNLSEITTGAAVD
ncbi:MAG: penicillin-binding protein 2 [Actinomycetota bacterium]